jgi:hypothetical protein
MRTQTVANQGVKEASKNNPLAVLKAKKKFRETRALYDLGLGLPSRAMLELYVLY